MNFIGPQHIQVKSINDFKCENFKELFDDGFTSGYITTSDPKRTYQVNWNKFTDGILVQRDKNGISAWTLFQEKLCSWSKLDFTDTARKWETRLTFQKQNTGLAKILTENIDKISHALQETDTYIKPSNFRNNTIQQDLYKVHDPLAFLLEKKKQGLLEQIQQISTILKTGLPDNGLWAQQRDTQNSVKKINAQVDQLNMIITNSKSVLQLYTLAAGLIDVSKNSIIYDALITRLISVGTAISKFTNDYFEDRISTSELHSYSKMIRNEGAITQEIINKRADTSIAYNVLLNPPSYIAAVDARKQSQVQFSYKPYTAKFSNILLEPSNTLKDIRIASEELRSSKNRWQSQLKLDENISNVISRLQREKSFRDSNHVLAKRLKQLESLQKTIFKSGELLSEDELKSVSVQYGSIIRANTLDKTIGNFLDSLPGTVSFWELSNYNDHMQSRINHLTSLRNMCHEESTLTSHALHYWEYHVTAHQDAIKEWTEGDTFSRTKTYALIPRDVDYPTWLDKGHQEFKQKAQEIRDTNLETVYQALQNVELIQEKNELVENLRPKTVALVQSSVEFKTKAKKLNASFTLEGALREFFGALSDFFGALRDFSFNALSDFSGALRDFFGLTPTKQESETETSSSVAEKAAPAMPPSDESHHEESALATYQAEYSGHN